jgi:hypothetical protein
MILVDYSGVAIGVITAMNLPPQEDLLRHTVLNTLRSIYKKHKAKYGEMIICCDHYSWRRDYFPNYKAARRASRSGDTESQEYWSAVFEIIGKIKDEIRDYFPWKVIHVHGAEADDAIAVLAQRTQDFGMHEDVLIVAADGDYKQLQTYRNVKQYSPQLKKMVKCDDPLDWLHTSIAKGQEKDGIPNVLSNDDFYIRKMNGEPMRAPPITAKKLEEWKNEIPETIRRNWDRNKTLMSFECIPEKVRNEIIESYEAQAEQPSGVLLNYFIAKRLRVLIDNINDFK